MKPEILKEPIDITTLLQDEENFLPLNEIYIGVFAKSLLETMLEEGEILEGDQDKVSVLHRPSIRRASITSLKTSFK